MTLKDLTVPGNDTKWWAKDTSDNRYLALLSTKSESPGHQWIPLSAPEEYYRGKQIDPVEEEDEGAVPPATGRSQRVDENPMLRQNKVPENPPAVCPTMTLKSHNVHQRYDRTGADTLPQSLACEDCS